MFQYLGSHWSRICYSFRLENQLVESMYILKIFTLVWCLSDIGLFLIRLSCVVDFVAYLLRISSHRDRPQVSINVTLDCALIYLSKSIIMWESWS